MTSAEPTRHKMSEKKFFLPRESFRVLVSHSGGCLATDRITVDGADVGYMYREEGDGPTDTGWRFFAGDEGPGYVDNPNNIGIYSINTIANYDPDIIPYLETEAPCAFEKIPGTSKYGRIE